MRKASARIALSSGRTGPVVSCYGLLVFTTQTLPPAGRGLKYIDTHSQKPPTGSNTRRDKILYQDRKSSLSPFKASKKHVTAYSIRAWRYLGWPTWPMTDVSASAYMLPDMHQYEIVLCEIIMQKRRSGYFIIIKLLVWFTVSVSLWHYRHYLPTTLWKICLNQPVYQLRSFLLLLSALVPKIKHQSGSTLFKLMWKLPIMTQH